MGEVKDIFEIKVNDKARAYLANFLMEGSNASYQSRQKSVAYIHKNEQEDRVPLWVWGGLFINLGAVIFYFVDGALKGIPIF